MENTNLRQLDYLARGWSIIPLQPKGKKPLIDWSEYQKRLPTEAEVIEWWRKWPEANTGIVTGTISHLAVVDIDGPVGMESSMKLDLPATLAVKSGRGLHLYFSHPGTSVKNCVSVAEKVDIRGDGGYAVAPYSVHENGHIYAFVGGYQALQQPLAAFPKNVLDLLGQPKDQQGYELVQTSEEPWATELLKGVSKERHRALLRLAGYFKAKGLPKDVAMTILLDWDTRNQPPKGSNEIRKQVEDVYTRYENKSSVSSIAVDVQGAGYTPVSVYTPKSAFSSFKEELLQGAKTIKTGFPTLDRHTGGLLVGNVSAIGAWPGVGKTAFSLGLARSLAEQGNDVLYFPTEMAVNELMRVFASAGLSIPFHKFMNGGFTEEENARIDAYLSGDVLSKLHIVPINTPSISDIANALEQVKPKVLFVDYIQHTKKTSDSVRQDIAELIMEIKGLAKKYQCAAVVTSQFRRPYRDKNGDPIPPTIFDFAESSQIEREVSMALLMSPTEERLTESLEFPVNFNLCKNRFGKVMEFQMNFNQQFVRFSE